MSEQQPDLQWAPIPPKPSNRGRIWLIIGLIVAFVVIVGVLVFFLIPRGAAPTPDPSATATSTPSATPSSTSTPTPTSTPTAPSTPDPTPSTVPSPPPPADPDVAGFRDQMSPLLDDAETGLGFVADASSSDEVRSIVEQLQIDAQRMSEAVPPSSIDAKWRDAVSAYGGRLDALRSAGTGSGTALDAARRSLDELRGVLGS
ncbi:hypothetical protein [Microbacterium sp. BF1]|uniref:hypothetical protein n=1 Tax=Microbacterium sp. BF1 TaxID=2821146 RepID=UPI001C4DEFBB|nr:hypothetical protein [Microbacterium sp. BF1]